MGERIRFAVQSGATSGEIFTTLGIELTQLLAFGPSEGLAAEVDAALDLVDDALRRVGQSPPPRRGS